MSDPSELVEPVDAHRKMLEMCLILLKQSYTELLMHAVAGGS